MRRRVAQLMESEVTVANRVPATERGESDAWVCTVLAAFWSETGGGEVEATTGLARGTAAISVQVAEADAGGYVEPGEYDGDGWTLRPGDRVMLGSLDYEGDLDGLLEAAAGMRSGVVTRVEDLRLGGAWASATGLRKWMSVLHAEAE